MSDLNDKNKDRWTDRRKSAYNWKRLIFMFLLLAAILILIKKLDTIGQRENSTTIEIIDSTATPTDTTAVQGVPVQ